MEKREKERNKKVVGENFFGLQERKSAQGEQGVYEIWRKWK